MSKQKNKKVNVKLKHVKDGQWYFKDIHQKTLSDKELSRLANGETLRMMTIHAPKHTQKTLEKKKNKC